MSPFKEWIEFAALGIEVLAVAIMVFRIVIGTARWLYHLTKNTGSPYEKYRITLGKSLLLGLELLVAADVIRTVALDATLNSLAVLAVLVVIRTFLGWSVTVEIEGHWPWQAKKESNLPLKGEL